MDFSRYGDCWFALQVRHGYETQVGTLLHQKGYEQFVPTYSCRRRWSDRWKDVELPLFAGYVFCKFSVEVHAPIITTSGVIRIVGIGRQPVPVENTEIEAVRAAMTSGFRTQPHPYLAVGSKVRIAKGPLSGVEGILSGHRGQYLVLSIHAVQGSVAVVVDGHSVTQMGENVIAGLVSSHRFIDATLEKASPAKRTNP